MNQCPQFSHLLYSNSWTLTQIGRDRQRSVALVGNIHQGGDTLESTFKLLRRCNPPKRHVALLRVFRRVVVSVFVSLKARCLDQARCCTILLWHLVSVGCC